MENVGFIFYLTFLLVWNYILFVVLQKNVPLPTYNFTKEGDAHCPTFIATVQINGACYSGGPAKSKKEAARKSACEAIRAIEPQYCECLCTKKQTVSILLSFF